MKAIDIVNRYLRLNNLGKNISSGDFSLKLHTEEDLVDIAIILDLISRNPGELGFIIDSKDYDEYLKTYTDAGGSEEEAVYSSQEFWQLKNYFKES